MRGIVNASAVVVAALCVVSFLLGGGAAVLGVVLAVVAVVAWRVAAASRPRPPRERRGPSGRMGHHRDADVVRHEGGQGQRVEHLVEPEPPR